MNDYPHKNVRSSESPKKPLDRQKLQQAISRRIKEDDAYRRKNNYRPPNTLTRNIIKEAVRKILSR
jgi:hypothetical protein